MGERSLSATSLNSYPPAYYDRPTPDMGPRQVSASCSSGWMKALFDHAWQRRQRRTCVCLTVLSICGRLCGRVAEGTWLRQ